jgi:hypothetical protein
LRQCLIEFRRVRRHGHRATDGWGGQHLANALKYSTAFPVILFTAWERNYNSDSPQMLSEAAVSHFWYVHSTLIIINFPIHSPDIDTRSLS